MKHKVTVAVLRFFMYVLINSLCVCDCNPVHLLLIKKMATITYALWFLWKRHCGPCSLLPERKQWCKLGTEGVEVMVSYCTYRN